MQADLVYEKDRKYNSFKESTDIHVLLHQRTLH